MTLPNTVIIVSYNLWLIPFGGAWCLGRADRCTNALVAKANQLRPVASSSELVVVAVQEAWAFRVGIFWPLLWLLSRSESAMLRSRLVAGAHETLAHKFLKDVIFALTALSVLVVQSWIPLLRRVQWNPKLRMASTLKRDASLSWSTDDSVAAFQRQRPWGWPPVLMDSGLHMSASSSADESGFVGFGRGGSHEPIVLKGVQWARWGALAVLNTHMVFDPGLDSSTRRRQRKALACLVSRAARTRRGSDE